MCVYVCEFSISISPVVQTPSLSLSFSFSLSIPPISVSRTVQYKGAYRGNSLCVCPQVIFMMFCLSGCSCCQRPVRGAGVADGDYRGGGVGVGVCGGGPGGCSCHAAEVASACLNAVAPSSSGVEV